jgi:hypothetical protein
LLPLKQPNLVRRLRSRLLRQPSLLSGLLGGLLSGLLGSLSRQIGLLLRLHFRQMSFLRIVRALSGNGTLALEQAHGESDRRVFTFHTA